MNMHTANNKFLETNNVFVDGGGGSVAIDSKLSETSENPVQNKVVTNALAKLNSDLKNRIRNIASGSIFDVVDSGLYYVTHAVTGKPSGLTGNSRGALIVVEFDDPKINYIQYLYIQGDALNQTIWMCLTLNETSYGWKQIALVS